MAGSRTSGKAPSFRLAAINPDCGQRAQPIGFSDEHKPPAKAAGYLSLLLKSRAAVSRCLACPVVYSGAW